MKETRLIKNLQNVSVSEGKSPAIALPETQLPPQIIIETTTERLNSAVLFELLIITNCMEGNVTYPRYAGHLLLGRFILAMLYLRIPCQPQP